MANRKFFCLVFYLVSGLTSCISAEDFWPHRSLSGNYHYGYIWAHRTRMEHLTTGHTQGLELSLVTQTSGQKWWHRVHRYPQTGFSIMYFDLANKVVGNAAAVIGFVNFPLSRSKNFLFAVQVGAGFGYLTKRFDPETDHKNMGIGSHGNSTIRLQLQTRYTLSKTLFVHLNYGITHFSNGAYRLPNLGINNISLSGGISYMPRGQSEFQKPEIPPFQKRWMIELVYGAGVKENYPPDGKQFFAHTFYVQAIKPLSHRSRLALGADVFYDLSLFRFVEGEKTNTQRDLKTIRAGVHAGYEVPLGRMTLLVHMGGYLLDHTKIDGSFYHRYGVKYAAGKHLLISLALKSHWARADYAEIGLGWRMRS